MKSSFSRSAMRPFDVLEAFYLAGGPLSLSELARLTDIPLTTCHGVVGALKERGLLYSLSTRELYPTRRLWDLARAINDNDPIAGRVSPALAALRDATGETVTLGTRQDDQVLYLLVQESAQAIRYSSKSGEFKPLHSSSIGKLLLSSMSPAELKEWLKTHELNRLTDRTIVSARQLLADLDITRARGYSISRGENVPDVMGIAASLRLGGSTMCIGVAGPLQRMEPKEAVVLQRLRECVNELEKHDASRV